MGHSQQRQLMELLYAAIEFEPARQQAFLARVSATCEQLGVRLQALLEGDRAPLDHRLHLVEPCISTEFSSTRIREGQNPGDMVGLQDAGNGYPGDRDGPSSKDPRGNCIFAITGIEPHERSEQNRECPGSGRIYD